MKDPLFEATQALRELGDGRPEASRFTRARVLASVRQRQRMRLRRSLVAMPLAALAVGSVAMAATGGYLPAPMQRWVVQLTGITPRPRQPTRIARAPASHDVQSESAPAPSSPLPEASPLSLAPEPSEQAIVPAAPQSAPSNDKPRAQDSPMTEAEFQRYRLAHEAHFVKRDPAAALAAWNDYLAHAPSGHLAVEARYNQALCLLKLGRTQEARRALAPFVAGAYGTYRRQEAQTLIATLDADAGH
jgi:hypothetical protein